MKYIDKLKHPKWQKKRLEVLNRDEFRCQLCWDNNSTLHVHHKYYKKGQEPWAYKLKAFITLCEHCHKKYHPENNKPQVKKDNKIDDIFDFIHAYVVSTIFEEKTATEILKEIEVMIMYLKSVYESSDRSQIMPFYEQEYTRIKYNFDNPISDENEEKRQNARSSFFDRFR